LLGKIVDSEAKLRLLLLHSRRPEYVPAWLDRAVVTRLHLEPLPADAIRRLAQARLGAKALPAALARQVTEKADGNPLFAEEIVSFLAEGGMLRTTAGTLEFDARAVAAALPASVQSLLTARVDHLAPRDRALLQAASVIGRRFDPGLLAVATAENGDIDARLAAMQALDLVRIDGRSGDYEFKHALVRDALYQSLLTEPRKALHLKIAKEIERRSSNRLAEVAEVLAHHYSQTALADKAFAFLAMAGDKSLSVYSLDDAGTHFAAALALLDKNQDCASDEQVAEFLVSYTLLLNVSIQLRAMIGILERYAARIARMGDDPRAVLIRYHYVAALLRNTRYREAAAVQRDISLMADRLGDSRSKAYSLVGETHVSTLVAPKPLNEFETLKREAIKAASETADAYIQSWNRFVIGWEEIHRGRLNDARDTARELMQVGRQLDDPRSTGLGFVLLAWISWVSDSFAEALEYSERAMAAAVTPWDRALAFVAKGGALVSLRRIDEGAKLLEESDRRCIADGDLIQSRGSTLPLGVCKVLRGDIGGGIRCLEEAVSTSEKEGYRAVADFGRYYLCEIYLQIIGGEEKLPFLTLLRNLPIILKVMATASSRISVLIARILENPQCDPDGYIVGRARMMLGLLYKAKKKHRLAAQQLTDARQILLPFGRTSALARVDAALAELG
jgi:tetratricopeptide (TPR) repeat protein